MTDSKIEWTKKRYEQLNSTNTIFAKSTNRHTLTSINDWRKETHWAKDITKKDQINYHHFEMVLCESFSFELITALITTLYTSVLTLIEFMQTNNQKNHTSWWKNFFSIFSSIINCRVDLTKSTILFFSCCHWTNCY